MVADCVGSRGGRGNVRVGVGHRPPAFDDRRGGVKTLLRASVAVVVAVATAIAAASVIGTAHADNNEPLGPGLVTVNVVIHHSTFSFSKLAVRPGTTARFVV